MILFAYRQGRNSHQDIPAMLLDIIVIHTFPGALFLSEIDICQCFEADKGIRRCVANASLKMSIPFTISSIHWPE
jgi:hypothetical protein